MPTTMPRSSQTINVFKKLFVRQLKVHHTHSPQLAERHSRTFSAVKEIKYVNLLWLSWINSVITQAHLVQASQWKQGYWRQHGNKTFNF